MDDKLGFVSDENNPLYGSTFAISLTPRYYELMEAKLVPKSASAYIITRYVLYSDYWIKRLHASEGDDY